MPFWRNVNRTGANTPKCHKNERRMKAEIFPHTLHFKQPAGTSRGVYTTRKVWYIRLTDKASGRYGIGECAPLPNLSCDDLPDYGEILAHHCQETARTGTIDYEALRPYPSMLFGLEMAMRQLEMGSVTLSETPFAKGKAGIPINGLIWMGDFGEMYDRIEEKMSRGFRCIKLKIGAIEFEKELDLLAHIRAHFGKEKIELRVDANGAFSPEDALDKLEALSQYDIHSIEQPVRAGQWEVMGRLCQQSPLDIALDEELIGINTRAEKMELLDKIRPQYIILKPSLHGGIRGAEEWIALAEERGIGWWATSALESNVGLNAIAHWCATKQPKLPQGLGTGLLFTDNIDYPLHIEGDCLWYDPEKAGEPRFDDYL